MDLGDDKGGDDKGGDSQFLIEMELISPQTYILVVTTYEQNVTGPFVVVTLGSKGVNITSMNNISLSSTGCE
jgi:hypothetical protein